MADKPLTKNCYKARPSTISTQQCAMLGCCLQIEEIVGPLLLRHILSRTKNTTQNMKTVIAFLFITVPFVKGQAPPQPPIQLEFVDKNLRLIDTADESKEMLRSTRYFKSFDAATNFNWTFQIGNSLLLFVSMTQLIMRNAEY